MQQLHPMYFRMVSLAEVVLCQNELLSCDCKEHDVSLTFSARLCHWHFCKSATGGQLAVAAVKNQDLCGF